MGEPRTLPPGNNGESGPSLVTGGDVLPGFECEIGRLFGLRGMAREGEAGRMGEGGVLAKGVFVDPLHSFRVAA